MNYIKSYQFYNENKTLEDRSLEDYVEEDLDIDLETIFAEMMDDDFKVTKSFQGGLVFNVFIIKEPLGAGKMFDIKSYKDYIKQLFDLMIVKGLQLYYCYYYKNELKMVDEDDNRDFRNKSWEEFWNSLISNTSGINSVSHENIITSITLAFGK